eukprot:1142891-Pelagomonas_calceolata.AAC.1
MEKRKEKKNYAGSETLPTSIKERGPHWCTDRMTHPPWRSEDLNPKMNFKNLCSSFDCSCPPHDLVEDRAFSKFDWHTCGMYGSLPG